MKHRVYHGVVASLRYGVWSVAICIIPAISNASPLMGRQSGVASTQWKIEAIRGAETFPLQPRQLPSARTVFGLRGATFHISDYRKWTFTVPVTSDIPVECRGIPDSRCRSGVTLCGELYPNSMDGHAQELPLYPVSEQIVRAQLEKGMLVAINANFLSTKSRITGQRHDGNVYYEQPCSVPLGSLIGEGKILSDARSIEGNGQRKHAIGYDILSFRYKDSQHLQDVTTTRNFWNSNENEPPPDTYAFIKNGVTTAVSGFIIAENGKPFLESCDRQTLDRCLGIPIASQYPAARTVIGIGDNRKINPYQMVVAVFQPGRRDARKSGLYPWEAADYMIEHFHSTTVFMLDGGGSSQFVTNTPTDIGHESIIQCAGSTTLHCSLPGDLDRKTGRGRWRPVTSALIISRQSGFGLLQR